MTSTGKYIEQLLKLLSIPAMSRDEKERSDYLENYLEQQGYSIQRIHHNLLVTTDGTMEGKKILLNSHMDTVAPTSGWNTDPFQAVQKEGR